MKKQTKKQLNKISKNLDYFFNLATKQDIKSGSNWYQDANNITKDISSKYDVNPYKVASVISCLSPRNRWEQNLKDAAKVCEAFKFGLHPEDIKVCTFHTNKYKAFNILAGNLEITLNSLKTFNFVQNIAYLNDDYLTVDIWHIRACLKEYRSIKNANIGKVAYQQIKELTIKKAEELNLTGFQYQAILWLSCQNYYNNLNN